MNQVFNTLLREGSDYNNTKTAYYALYDIGDEISQNKTTTQEDHAGIDCLINAGVNSRSSEVRYGAVIGLRRIFMSTQIKGAKRLDSALVESDVYKSLNTDQRKLLASIMQEASNEYIGPRREEDHPNLDSFSGKIFAVDFGRRSPKRQLSFI